MAASPRPLLLSRNLSFSLPPLLSRPRLLFHPFPKARSFPSLTCCLVSGVDGSSGGDFVSTPRSIRREFSALADLLRRIEPLDTSVVGKSVSAVARDSMKRTVSTMLGLLPSDQFCISVRVSSWPLHHLLVSSIITGYTMWNAEYRLSLMKNFESSPSEGMVAAVSADNVELREENKLREDGDVVSGAGWSTEIATLEKLDNLSSTALSYIQELELQLATTEKELHDQEQEYIHLESSKEDNNDLLKYLRSLEPDMVSELSKSSSSEVEEIIQQLVQNIHTRFLNNECSNFSVDSDKEISSHHEKDVNQEAIITTRDYLAKLLFWCMLLGHHLRGLEYRLHLSCVVGLL